MKKKFNLSTNCLMIILNFYYMGYSIAYFYWFEINCLHICTRLIRHKNLNCNSLMNSYFLNWYQNTHYLLKPDIIYYRLEISYIRKQRLIATKLHPLKHIHRTKLYQSLQMNFFRIKHENGLIIFPSGFRKISLHFVFNMQ